MKRTSIATPLGEMTAIADDTYLHLLEFADRKNLGSEIDNIQKALPAPISFGDNHVTDMITQELDAYFSGTLKKFKTPLKLYGSDFQQSVLKSLMAIEFGQTRSYKQQADMVNNPKGIRAVARANGMNQIAIVIPCHRVIGSDGSLTGYAGGLDRKKWLLNHEGALEKPLL